MTPSPSSNVRTPAAGRRRGGLWLGIKLARGLRPAFFFPFPHGLPLRMAVGEEDVAARWPVVLVAVALELRVARTAVQVPRDRRLPLELHHLRPVRRRPEQAVE